MSAIAKFDKVVRKEMSRYGFDLIVKRNSANSTTYNPALGRASSVSSTLPCRGILFDLTLQSNGNQTMKDSLIQAGDKQLYIQPITKQDENFQSPPTRLIPGQDEVVIGSDVYRIVTFKEVNPSAADSCLWELYIRR
jgi:hypothetical protein